MTIAGLGTWLGEFNADGSIKVDAIECAFTHSPCKGIHAVRERVPGTLYFYRVRSDQYPRFTDEHRKVIYAAVSKPAVETKPELKTKKEIADG